MKLVAVVQGKQVQVEISKSNGNYRLTWNEKSFNVDAIRTNQNSFSLLVGGSSYEVTIENQGSRYFVYFHNDTIELELFDARRFGASAITKKNLQGGAHEILAPMPGKIIKLSVSENGTVKEGDPLLIMEAMKMQNELKAPAAGTVKKVRVKEGEAVSSQQILMVLE
jgi:biotin carboxyl carrier protein